MKPRPGRYVRRNGDPGKNITGVNTEAEKITGRVTDYITIEENLS